MKGCRGRWMELLLILDACPPPSSHGDGGCFSAMDRTLRAGRFSTFGLRDDSERAKNRICTLHMAFPQIRSPAAAFSQIRDRPRDRARMSIFSCYRVKVDDGEMA